MKTPLRAGVIGVGVGKRHIEGYLNVPDAELVALCDVNEARLNEMGNQYNVARRYTDYRAMLSAGNLDAISICLPNNLHAPVSIAALEAGIHVLCEKPLAESLAAAEQIMAAAAKAKSKFMMCYNRRYRQDIAWIKQLIDEDKLGRIYQIKAGWVRETGIPAGWFTNKEVAGGGPLIDLGVHMLDAVLWLLDYPDPLTVSGAVQTNFGTQGDKTWSWHKNKPQAFTVEDSVTAFVRLSNDATLFLETSWASHMRPGADDFFITLWGTKGSVEFYVPNYRAEDNIRLYTEIEGLPVTVHPDLKTPGHDHDLAVAEFVRCIREDIEPTATVAQGHIVMQVIDAIYRSAHIKQEIALPAAEDGKSA